MVILNRKWSAMSSTRGTMKAVSWLRRSGAYGLTKGSGRVVLLTFAAGLIAMQIAWWISVPPFRGIDEIDHVFRAASVVHGHPEAGSTPVEDGRGGRVAVPASIVNAASEACESLKYKGPDDCRALGRPNERDLVDAASSASLYLPAYYAAVGIPSRILEGEAAVYGMRLISVLFCDLLLLLAAASLIRRRSPWPLIGFIAALTPVVVYSSTLVAPNGVGLAGGMLMWAAWTGVSPESAAGENKRNVALGGLGATATCLAHLTGPLWVLSTAILVVWADPGALRVARIQAMPRLMMSAAAIVLATAIAATWSLVTGSNDPRIASVETQEDAPAALLLLGPVLWLFQSISAAPRAGSRAPLLAYALAIALIFLLIALGARSADRRTKQAMAAIAVTVTLLPIVLTWMTFATLGLSWQGRYSLPLSIGLIMLAAGGLAARRRKLPILVVAGGASVLALTHALALSRARELLVGEGAAYSLPTWVAPGIAAVGVLMWVCGFRTTASSLRE